MAKPQPINNMPDSEISISEALNHVQSWLNAGEYDKAIQGAQEILELEPGNARALMLMKQAEERRHGLTPLKAAPPPPDPLSELQVERRGLGPEEVEEKRRLFLAMLIPALVVVLLGGGAIAYLAQQGREEIMENQTQTNYLEENKQRVEDLKAMSQTLEIYRLENGAYPSVSQIEAALGENSASDPHQGEIDKAGKVFGYIYAVYDGLAGSNSVYIISALFEDSKGFGYAWSEGAPEKNYPDYRDYEKEHVTFIGGKEDEVQKPGAVPLLEPEPSPKVKPSE